MAWLFSGNLTVASGSDLPSTIHVGDPFSAVLHFDTSTPANLGPFNQANCFPNSGGPNSICTHHGAPPSAQLWSDVTVNGVNYGIVPEMGPLAEMFNSITVRNNSPDPANPTDIIDGYAFNTDRCFGACGAGDEEDYVFVRIRGLDLTLVTDARQLPMSPSLSMNTVRSRDWIVCRGILNSNLDNACGLVDVEGVFNSVSQVPEPGTLVFFSIGLVGLCFSRRRA